MATKVYMSGMAVAVSLAFTAPAFAQTEIQWWHAMGGELGVKLEAIAKGFNESQSDFKIVPVYKGSYPETLTAAIAAFRAKQNPAIVQVFEVGTGTMMAAKGAVYPVHKLFADHNEAFDPKDYLAPVVGYYSDTDGNILSLPFNSSTPIMYYNKDAFEKAGLDRNTPPRTWAEVEAFSKKILETKAAKCGFTTGWVSWVQLENLSALHDKPYGTLENGFGGLGAEFEFNGDAQVKHFANLKKWADEGIFQYGGPVGGNDAPPKFYSGDCAIYMNSSASRAGVVANAKNFEVGFAPLPFYDDVITEPKNSIIGGATLWVLQGRPEKEYEGAAKFFSYLSRPEVQAEWHQDTGYLPITYAAFELGKTQGYYDKNPGADVAINQITRGEPSVNSKGIRFGNLAQARDVIDSEFEALLAGKKSAKDALDAAVTGGNRILRDFEAANK